MILFSYSPGTEYPDRADVPRQPGEADDRGDDAAAPVADGIEEEGSSSVAAAGGEFFPARQARQVGGQVGQVAGEGRGWVERRVGGG